MVFGVGPKCGAALVQHPDVPMISFTGSTATGRYIMENSAPYFKKLSLEVWFTNLSFKLMLSLFIHETSERILGLRWPSG
jgi:hypothetical protein